MANPDNVSRPWKLKQNLLEDTSDRITIKNVWTHYHRDDVIVHFQTDQQLDVNDHVEIHSSEVAARKRLQYVVNELNGDSPTSVNGISLLTGGGSDFDLGTFPSKSAAIEAVLEYSEENS